MDKQKKVFLSVLGILFFIVITIGITYAIFTYAKHGDTNNTITTGKLTFLYTENTGTGTGINITDAFPVSDTLGKAYASDDRVFDFKIESEIVGNTKIPYEVTVEKIENSTLEEQYAKLYLTDTTEDDEEVLLDVTRYSDLPTSSTSDDEKQIYYDEVEANEDYLKKFRLRMWIADTNEEEEPTNQEEINEKSFTIKVNVYADTRTIKKQNLNVAQNVLYSNPENTECTTVDCAINELFEKIGLAE